MLRAEENANMEKETEIHKSFINRTRSFFKRAHILLSKFLYTDYYIAFIAVMVFLSWVTNNLIAELTVFFVIMAYTLYTQKTMQPLIPILAMIAFMLPNNFQLNGASSYWYFGIVGVLPISGFFWFFIKNKVKFKKSRFLIPSLVFCGALLCSGLFTSYYFMSVNFMMIGCLVFLYLFVAVVLFNGIEKLDFYYLGKCLFAVGLVVATQVLTAYLRAGNISAALEDKETTYIGWGKSNTVAGVLAMCVPTAFYLASKSKRNYVFLAGAVYFILGVLFTESRGGVLFMVLLLPFSIYFMFRQTPKERHKKAVVTLTASLVLVTAILLIFWNDIGKVIMHYIVKGFDDSGRFPMYEEAWKTFLKHPPFGVGWAYDKTGTPGYTLFYTVHCTVLQYLASGGIFLGAAAVWLFGKRYLAFYADHKPYHIFFLLSLLGHDLHGLLDNIATTPYNVMIAGIIFLALEKDIRPEVEAAKKLEYKKEKFYF